MASSEGSQVPPRAPTMASTEKPLTWATGATGMETRSGSRRAKFSTAWDTSSRPRAAPFSGAKDRCGGLGELGLVGGGEKEGVVAGGHVPQGGHDALVVHHHGLHRAGDQGQLLDQVVAGHGDALAHQHFVARAAQARQVDALGPQFLGPVEQLRVLGGLGHHLRHQGVVAVEDDVHLVLLQHPQVDLGGHGLGGAEEDVGDLGGDHGAAPAVGQGVAQGVQQQVHRVVVHPHVGAVQHLRRLPGRCPGA